MSLASHDRDRHGIQLAWTKSTNAEVRTPSGLFQQLDLEFHFTIDLAASAQNAKCTRYYDSKIDSLSQSWKGEVGFLNPPYGRKVGTWVKKAYQESRQPSTVIVMLLYARTGTSWFHEYVLPFAEVRFLRGRLTFEGEDDSAPFDSLIAIFPKDRTNTPTFSCLKP
jgi:site-specific DNA-methyltransferase (adenine-specific)